MKITYLFVLIILLTVGMWLLFHSLNQTQQISLATDSSKTPTVIPTPTVTKIDPAGIQIIKAAYGPPFGFTPTELKVKAGLPVRLEVYSNIDGIGCMGSIMIPQLLPNNVQFFAKGETNVFEFTPTVRGTYSITCAMGVPHANLIVE